MSERRAVLVAPTPSQPRFHKRAELLLREGYSVDVYAFDRGYYKENSFQKECRLVLLPTDTTHGKFAARIGTVLNAVRKIRAYEQAASAPEIVYAFGLDNAVTAALCFPRSARLFYEFGDLRGPQLAGGWRSLPIRVPERWIIQRSHCVAVTSPAFLEWYLRLHYPESAEKAVVVENRLADTLLQHGSRPAQKALPADGQLRLGIIGFLRYETVAERILAALDRVEQPLELQVFGDGPAKTLFQQYQNPRHRVEVHGAYRNPEELPKVYNAVDLNIVLYDASDINVLWAIPNKLYESAFFGVPILASSGTEFARRVLEWGIGYEADPASTDSIFQVLNSLTASNLEQRASTALAIPDSALLNDDELLRSRLRSA